MIADWVLYVQITYTRINNILDNGFLLITSKMEKNVTH